MSDMNEFFKDYIFSGIDDEGLTSNRLEFMKEFYSESALAKLFFEGVNPSARGSRTYLVFVSEDTENAFMYPAQALRQRIKKGAYGFIPGLDQVHLIDIHSFEDMNYALKNHNNIHAMFIFGHSYYGSEGFAVSRRSDKRYNIGYNAGVANSMPVTHLYTSNVLSEGFIHLYSCDAVSDEGEDIAHAMADHFGVRVWASKSGVSLSPFWVRNAKGKTRVYTSPREWLDDKTVGFEWVLPEKKE